MISALVDLVHALELFIEDFLYGGNERANTWGIKAIEKVGGDCCSLLYI